MMMMILMSCRSQCHDMVFTPRVNVCTLWTHPGADWLEAELADVELPVLARSMLPPLWPESLLLVLDSRFLLILSLASCNDGELR